MAYDYTDEDGKLIFQICRKDPKSDFPVRRPDGKGDWIWNLQDERRILYRLPEVLAAQLVCIAEGEKDCDNLAKFGFIATTNPFGAGKWRDEYSETLRGKDVVVFGDVGDPDSKGEKHTKQVIASLLRQSEVDQTCRLPDGFHDVSDYIASLPAEKARDAIAKLIDETPKVPVTSEAADDEQTDLTSLTSRAVDYPAPPDKAAYYGLAGEIVKESRRRPKPIRWRCWCNFSLRSGTSSTAWLTRLLMAHGIISTCSVSWSETPAKAARGLR